MKTPCLLVAVSGLAVLSAVADPSLTIYNQNFAVVRDTVPLDLKAGVNDVNFADTTAHLEPDSVILRDPTGKVDLQVLEQNYRNDPASQELLLGLNEGKTIDFLVKHDGKSDETVQGKIIRSGFVPNGQATVPVIEVDGKLRFGLPGLPLFPSLGDDTILKPTLLWKLQSPTAAKLNAEVAYVTGGMSWEADYNIVAAPDSDVIDLVGWITMNNQSGKSFPNAMIRLMAGDVNKIQPRMESDVMTMSNSVALPASAPAVTEKAFEDFHLYSLPRETDLKDGETKQVEFVHAAGVQAQRIYVYDGEQYNWMGWPYNDSGLRQNSEIGTDGSTKVAIVREFKNSTANHLGVPLPKGKLRFYKQDGTALEFTGENMIDHTPRDETLKVYTGNAFDLVGERTRTGFRVNNNSDWADESLSIKVTNHKEQPVEIRVVEHLTRYANWTIVEKSDSYTKNNADEIEFHIPLKPSESHTVTYKVHYSW